MQTDIENGINFLIEKTCSGGEPSRAKQPYQLASHDQNRCSECNTATIHAYLHHMRSLGLWPFGHSLAQKTLYDLINSLKSTYIARDFPKRCDCTTCETDLDKYLRTAVAKFKDAFDGLCLDCVKNGHKTEDNKRCRFAHKGFQGITEDV